MQNPQSQHVIEGVILTRSLEHLLRKLIRLLVGRLSLIRLQELIHKIYVHEAERRLKADFPDKRVTLSQLALLTGIDTRMLTKVINSETYAQPMHENAEFLNEMTPETRILSVWMSDPRFFDYASGKPFELNIGSGSKSFSNLVCKAITTRGLTIQSIVNRLEFAGSIEVDRQTQRVKLIAGTYYPFLTDDKPALLEVGFATAAALLQTVTTNLERATAGEEKLYQRSAFTHHLSPKRRAEFRGLLQAFLAKSDEECKTIMAGLEDKMPLPGQITAGVSMFYFEENQAT